jgi:hypothetical protein
MKLSTFIIIVVIIIVGASVWMNVTERRAEKIFSADGIQVRVLEVEAKGRITKIIEPNGDLSAFSDGARKKELSRIARKQRGLVCQADYFYHRIKRYIKKKFVH